MADTIDSLKKKMKYAGSILAGNWDLVRELVSFLNENKDRVEIVSQENTHSYGKQPDYFDIKTWSTYDNSSCIRLEFKLGKGNTMTCSAQIWDGEILDGDAVRVRFTVNIIMPETFIKMLEYSVNRAFQNRLEVDYDTYLEQCRFMWIANRRRQVLRSKEEEHNG